MLTGHLYLTISKQSTRLLCKAKAGVIHVPQLQGIPAQLK
jgi:hypothetical protein